MPAGGEDYDGVRYEDMAFEELDWSEAESHDPGRRSTRTGRSEVDVPTEWATEACSDPRRIVCTAGSRSGLTVKVIGRSPSGGFVVVVIAAPKETPPADRWWGATAWKANERDMERYGNEEE